MRIILLLSVAALASAASLDVDQCVDGESFWCMNLSTAETCDKVNYCKETVWKTFTQEETLSDLLTNSCSDCKRFFTSLKSFLGNDTQAFLRDVAIDQLCPMMGQYRKQCEEMVKMYLPVTLQLAASFIDSDRICKQMKMCPKSQEFDQDFISFDLNSIDWDKLKASDEQISEKNSEKTSCSDCNKFFSSLKSFLGPDTQVFVKDVLLYRVCPTLRQSQKLRCRIFVEKLLPRFLQSALMFLDPSTTCKGIGMCQRSDEIFTMDELRPDISIDQDGLWIDPTKGNFTDDQPSSCKDCVQFFTALKKFLKTETVALIQDVLLDQVCSRMGTYKKQCEEVVKSYLPEVVSFSLNFLDPNKVCSAMKMCKKSFSGIDSSPMLEIDLSSIDWNELLGVTEGDPQKCAACKTAALFVQRFFKSDQTKNMIQTALKNRVCPLLKAAAPICVQIVDSGLPALLDIVAMFLEPDQFCGVIRLCPKQDTDAALEQEQLTESLPWNEKSLDCESCKSMADSLIEVINATVTQHENLKTMSEKCKIVKLVEECDKFISKFGRHIIKATVTEKLGPKEMCTKFKLCPDHTSFNFDFADRNQVL